MSERDEGLADDKSTRSFTLSNLRPVMSEKSQTMLQNPSTSVIDQSCISSYVVMFFLRL